MFLTRRSRKTSTSSASLIPQSALNRRLIDIFPPGFDARSSTSSYCSRGHYTYDPERLLRILTENYHRNKDVEYTVVKSAWYGKQERSARHEFILLEVEDTAIQGLTNYLVIDRNVARDTSQAPPPPPRAPFHLELSSSSYTTANDSFKVSYDGNLEQLLYECQLSPCKWLEQIRFDQNEKMPLYQLAVAVHHISSQHPLYNPVDSNCYWFTSLIWECVRQLRPSATRIKEAAKKRGRIGRLPIRYIPNPLQVMLVHKEVQERISGLEAEFSCSESDCVSILKLLTLRVH